MLRYLSINLCPGTRHFVVSSDPVVQNLSRLVPVNLPTVRGIRQRIGPVSSPSSAQNTVNPPFLSPWISVLRRQQGGVVDDGAVLGPVNDLHGDELGAEGQDVELGASGLVLSHHLWDGLALHTPAGELEDGDAILLRLSCCGKKEQ
ncbi:hypothetical protein EYF80_010052 [Liparis tanakae]|uniref:Uncharacterized protein n=1 Tax=Liparis tanakae TaxID=230148 RepID=A0A4Z2IPS8_9TELE|nr:hypothetical protein EYF80_010052 [Liparis tanakae]